MRIVPSSTGVRVATGLLVAWVALAGPVAAARPAVPAGADPMGRAARSEHARILAYWTAERMRAAIPADPVFAAGGASPTGASSTGATSTGATGSARQTPAKAPSPSPGTCGTSGGTDWTCDGAVQTSVGKVFFTKGGSNYSCSGSIVTGASGSDALVITAGHCVWDFNRGVFATNWLFAPNYDAAPNACADTIYGCWTAKALFVHANFANESGFTTTSMKNDWGFAKVGPGGLNGTTDLDVAPRTGFSLAGTNPASGDRVDVFGYPAAKKYTGKSLVYCDGTLSTDPKKNDLTWQLPNCGLTAGSSGGPWFSGFSGGTGTVFSVYSYYYSGVDSVFGSKFGSATTATYNAAKSGGTNTVVGG